MIKNEMNLIGLLIQQPLLIYDISNIIKTDDLTDAKIKSIYDYINDNSNITYSDLENNRLINTDLYNTYISNIREHNIVKVAKTLKRKSTVKRFKEFIEISKNEVENQIDVYEYLDNFTTKVTDIKECAVPEKIEKGITILERLQGMLKKSNENAIRTHYPSLDNILGNIEQTDLVIIAARASMGKTVFAQNLLHNFSLFGGAKVGLINLEMSNEQIMLRMIARISDIPLNVVKDDYDYLCNDNMFMEKISYDINRMNYLTYDGWQTKLSDLKRIIRRFKRLKCDVVIIDYLGLIEPPKAENRNNEISLITRQLKHLTKEVEMPIILLSQLNRGVEMRTLKVPMMSDLRDSGAIEQDADKILMLYRAEKYGETYCTDKTTFAENKLEVLVVKNRQGKLGTAILDIEIDKMKITDPFLNQKYNNFEYDND